MRKLIFAVILGFTSIAANAQQLDDPRVFDPVYYLNKYADLQKAYGNDLTKARQHWIKYGIREGRQGSPSFNPAHYLSNYTDLTRAFGGNNYQAAIQHWINYGINEKRRGAFPIVMPSTDNMCWAETQTRGAGTIPNKCGPNEELDAGLCYPKCKPGYVGVGPVCWKKCPSGFRDDGAFCAKPAPYGRGAGYPWKFGDGFNLNGAKKRCEKANRQGCEQNGAIMYPKCKPGYHPVGCCVCSPNCPSGFADIGVSCAKPSYGRGVGKIPTGCPAGMVNQAGLCYTPCGNGYNGVGPVCWADACPKAFPVKCGAGCAKSSADCADAIVNQVITPIEMVASITSIIFTGGASAPAQAAAKSGAKIATKTAIKQSIKSHAKRIGKNLSEEALQNATETFYEAQRTGELHWGDLDPTGIANVVLAFNKPLCKNYK